MPRPNVSKERTAQILDAAATTFSRLGLTAARMEDIATTVGVSKGTLYLYFTSKDAVIDALITRSFAPLTAALAALNTDEMGAGERLLMYTERILTAFEAMQPIYPLVLDFLALAARDPDANTAFISQFTAYQAELRRLLEEGISSGEFIAHDTALTSAALLTVLDGSLLIAIMNRELKLREHGLSAVRLLLTGIQQQ